MEASFRVGIFGSGAGATGLVSSSSLTSTGRRSVEGSGESAVAMVALAVDSVRMKCPSRDEVKGFDITCW